MGAAERVHGFVITRILLAQTLSLGHTAMMMRIALAILVLACALALVPARAQDEVVVDVELVLAVDVSLSMSQDELEIQRHGYAAALADEAVIDAIAKGLHQKIAVTYLEWAGDARHRQVIPWRLIESPEDARRVSEELAQSRPRGARRTSISGAMREASALFENNGFRGLKRVIDISGDGPNNQGMPVLEARAAATEQGITINGLPLMTNGGMAASFNIKDLDVYYANCVIGGPAAFSIPVTEWTQFPEAVRRKLVLELAGRQPEETPRLIRIADTEPYDCMIGEKLWLQRRELFWGDN